jgi:hypothetical protein
MSTFNYALPKTFIGTVDVKDAPTNVKTWRLSPGEIGLFDRKTNKRVVNGSTTSDVIAQAEAPYVYLAQGSYYTVDNIGKTPLQGLTESLKTPGINAKYVSKFYKIAGQSAKQHIVTVGQTTAVSAGAPTGAVTSNVLNFESNQTYNLRVEAKGSVPLRVLQRQMYKNVPYFTGCESSDCITGCDKEYVDPAAVMYGWAAYINADPLLSLFVTAQAYVVAATTTYTNAGADTIIVVASATGIAAGQLVQGVGIPVGTTVVSISGTNITISAASAVEGSGTAITFSTPLTSSSTFSANSTTAFTTPAFIVLTAAYSDTVFGDCSFNPKDFYQVEPIILGVSLVDKDGNPCSVGPKINSYNYSNGTINGTAVAPVNTGELQAPQQPEGVGETVIRDYMLSREYEQIHFSTNPRYREVEKDPIFTAVSRSSTYTRYYIQFHVPIGANPNNTFSTQQYLYCFAILGSDTTSQTNFEAMIGEWLAANGSYATLETIV